mmetsp:Transcript_36810/g.86482  ORF Transcript_36810/g.86482 Transcript_36810/m.86482 type:complete len:376 (-) Transcript_36810:335-1462(-)
MRLVRRAAHTTRRRDQGAALGGGRLDAPLSRPVAHRQHAARRQRVGAAARLGRREAARCDRHVHGLLAARAAARRAHQPPGPGGVRLAGAASGDLPQVPARRFSLAGLPQRRLHTHCAAARTDAHVLRRQLQHVLHRARRRRARALQGVRETADGRGETRDVRAREQGEWSGLLRKVQAKGPRQDSRRLPHKAAATRANPPLHLPRSLAPRPARAPFRRRGLLLLRQARGVPLREAQPGGGLRLTHRARRSQRLRQVDAAQAHGWRPRAQRGHCQAARAPRHRALPSALGGRARGRPFAARLHPQALPAAAVQAVGGGVALVPRHVRLHHGADDSAHWPHERWSEEPPRLRHARHEGGGRAAARRAHQPLGPRRG